MDVLTIIKIVGILIIAAPVISMIDSMSKSAAKARKDRERERRRAEQDAARIAREYEWIARNRRQIAALGVKAAKADAAAAKLRETVEADAAALDEMIAERQKLTAEIAETHNPRQARAVLSRERAAQLDAEIAARREAAQQSRTRYDAQIAEAEAIRDEIRYKSGY